MKLLHLSDLHIGKAVNEISMLVDQKYILEQIVKIVQEQTPNAVLIAGDIYDKSVPSAEAVELYDSFITQLAKTKIPVYIISGNHDSPERLSCCSRLIEINNIYINGVFNGKAQKYILSADGESINIYTLPFIKPSNVRAFYDNEITSYTDAVKTVLDNSDINSNEVNILVAHQFVTGEGTAVRVDSENVSVGGVDNVDAGIFKDFNYVALGHLHTSQNVSDNIMYCGSPLKYSASECTGVKSVIMAEIINGDISVSKIPLIPQRDMRTVKGSLQSLVTNPQGNIDDYIFALLTDEIEPIDPMGCLRSVYPNIMGLRFDNKRTSKNNAEVKMQQINSKSSIELFNDFYVLQNNHSLNEEQSEIISKIFEQMGEV